MAGSPSGTGLRAAHHEADRVERAHVDADVPHFLLLIVEEREATAASPLGCRHRLPKQRSEIEGGLAEESDDAGRRGEPVAALQHKIEVEAAAGVRRVNRAREAIPRVAPLRAPGSSGSNSSAVAHRVAPAWARLKRLW